MSFGEMERGRNIVNKFPALLFSPTLNISDGAGFTLPPKTLHLIFFFPFSFCNCIMGVWGMWQFPSCVFTGHFQATKLVFWYWQIVDLRDLFWKSFEPTGPRAVVANLFARVLSKLRKMLILCLSAGVSNHLPNKREIILYINFI